MIALGTGRAICSAKQVNKTWCKINRSGMSPIKLYNTEDVLYISNVRGGMKGNCRGEDERCIS